MCKSHRSWPGLVLLAVVLLVGACGVTQGGPAIQGDATHGRSQWALSACIGCHGVNGEGSTGGPALANTPLTVREFTNIVRRGGPGMPRYTASRISDEDLEDLYAWFQNPVPAATRGPGQDPWAQSPCTGCHGAKAEGGSAPALAGEESSYDEFQRMVRGGEAGMPAYSAGQIGDTDLQRMYDWLQAQPQVPVAQDALWVQAGCGGCHGANAEGGIARALAGEESPYDEFQRVVRGGEEGMPAYSASQIGDTDLQRMYDWLQAQPQVPVTQDALWVQAGCGGCHGANAEGGIARALAGEESPYDEFQRVVRGGEAGMPAYSASQIGDMDLQRMYDWLQAQPQVPVAQDALWVQTGCGGCHGANAEGGIARALAGEESSYDEFQRVVRGGEEGMPAYSTGQISDTDLQRMYDWLTALP